MIWNWEFRSGQWQFLENSGERPLYEVLIRFLHGGHLLDLGCGNGAARCELPAGSMSRYVGVDLSSEAIRRTAERSSALPDLTDGQSLIVGDIADPGVLSQAGGPFDVVLLRESIYFVKVERVAEFLSHAAELLAPEGVIVIKIHDRFRYVDHVEQIRQCRPIIEAHEPQGSTASILVTR